MNLEQFNRILRSVLWLPVCLLLGMAATLYWQIHEADVAVGLIERADQRITEAMQLDHCVLDEETALRGFEITRDPAFERAFQTARLKSSDYLDTLIAADGTQDRAQRLRRLREGLSAWEREFAVPLVASLATGTHVGNAERHALSERQMQEIHAEIEGLKEQPRLRRVERIQMWQDQVRRTKIILGVLALAVGLGIGLFMRHQLNEVSAAYRMSLNILSVRADELFRSEQKLQTTLASIGDGVLTCDADGHVRIVNEVAQQLTGWTESEARSQPLESVFPIVDETTGTLAESPVSRVKRLGRTAVGQVGHTILRRRDGTEIFIDHSGAPIRDQHANLVGIVIVFRDVTLRRKSQEALVANEKLAVAGRLAASIAHEIHNPLDSVVNLLYLMEGPSTPEESAQFLQMARQELLRVTQISRAMLGLYRESKQPVAINLKAMLDSVLLLLERRFLDLEVTVVSELPAELEVHGYPAELRQVFTNLLTNAAEATGPGGTVRLGVDLHTEGVTVVVSDDGPGIPETIREHLFQPFFTTKAEKGTGLGLWVSRGIVKKHGGDITVESETDAERHGTRVRVSLNFEPVPTLV